MLKNVGKEDRIIRLVVVALISILYFTNVITGTWAIVAGVIAAILLVTSLVGRCGLYIPFGISTCKEA